MKDLPETPQFGHRDLGAISGEDLGFLRSGGWSAVEIGKRHDGGITSHRGVLHPDEHVDADALQAAVEDALGFSREDVTFAYQNGRPTAEQRQLRERIDSRMLALSRSGGNMTVLADALGIGHSTVDRAIVRARDVEVAPQVKNPAVLTRRICFKCESPGAVARQRRFSDSPKEWRGTINLCNPCYARGFETRPGNPAYWEFKDRKGPVAA